MRIVFAGTPVFAAIALKALLEAGHEVSAVFCQPDRPAGRGQKQLFGPVKQVAIEHGLQVFQPTNLKEPDILEWIKSDPSQLWVVAAYGLLLPPDVLSFPPMGCLNIHASLLPRWRGAAPIHRAIQAGDRKTGVAIMQMEEGLDTGPILFEESIEIGPRDTTETLHNRLATLGAQAIVKALENLDSLRLNERKQSSEGVRYAHKIKKEEARINWTLPAAELERHIRAFTPSPGARFCYKEEMIKVGEAFVAALPPETPKESPAGLVINNQSDLYVLTGQGVLRFTRLQRPGAKMIAAHDFMAGCPIPVGTKLD